MCSEEKLPKKNHAPDGPSGFIGSVGLTGGTVSQILFTMAIYLAPDRCGRPGRPPFAGGCPLPAPQRGLFGVARWRGLPRSTGAVAGAARLYGPFIATADRTTRAGFRIRRIASALPCDRHQLSAGRADSRVWTFL